MCTKMVFLAVMRGFFVYIRGKILSMKQEEKADNKLPLGCIIGLVIGAIVIFAFIYKSGFFSDSDSKNPCLISEHFIKQDLNYPDNSEIPFLECNITETNGNEYTILRKVEASNAFGVKKTYIYKVKMAYVDGEESDAENWVLLEMRNEEYKN